MPKGVNNNENKTENSAFVELSEKQKFENDYRKKICDKLKVTKDKKEHEMLFDAYVNSGYRSMYYNLLDKRYNVKDANEEEKVINEKELAASLKDGVARNLAGFSYIMSTNFGRQFEEEMRKNASSGIAINDQDILKKRDEIFKIIHDNVDSKERRRHRQIATALGSEQFTPKYGYIAPGEYELLTGTNYSRTADLSKKYGFYKERKDAYELENLTKNNNALLADRLLLLMIKRKKLKI